MNFLELIAGKDLPTKFRYLVIAESHTVEDPKTFQEVTKTIYCSLALEWYVTASGETIQQAINQLEFILFGQALIYYEHPGAQVMLAPESYQRVATSGDYYIEPDPEWRAFMGTDRRPIVARGVLDMAVSKCRLVGTPRKRT